MKTRPYLTVTSAKPTIVGTDVTVEQLIEALIGGRSLASIVGVPGLEAAAEALRLAGRLLTEQALQDHCVWITITEFARAVAAEYGERLSRVILFGSQAQGTACRHSDADVAVVLHDPMSAEALEEIRDNLLQDALDLLMRHGVQIHVIVVTEGRLMALDAVRKYGIEVPHA